MTPSAPGVPRAAAILALTALFAFRLFFGLSMPFWFEDERQVYLIGLQSFARGEWPWFGADVVWTGGQLPGALLGWAIRLPLELWPAPEAPAVLLNIVSLAALSLLAWYLSRRLPAIPRWLIWTSLFTLPWTLNFSTHVINPSYALAGAVIFFVGFFEATPVYTRRIVPFGLAWAMIGTGLVTVMQLHMSWVLLVPYAAFAVIAVVIHGGRTFGMSRMTALTRATLCGLAGAAVPGALLAPTLFRYGWGGAADTFTPHWQNPLELVTTAARVLSFASYETNRFIGMSTAERVLVIWRQPWLAIAVVPVAIAGFVHPIWMAVSAFRKSAGDPRDWTAVRLLLAATMVLITGSYYFSVRGPQAHSFYVVLPIAVLFAFTCWSERARARGGRLRGMERAAAVVIVLSILMHTGLAIDRRPRLSLYVDRDLIAAAIADRNDRYLGDRRETAQPRRGRDPRPSDPVTDVNGYRSAQATDDLHVTEARWSPVAGRISSFDVAIENRGRVAAWLDIRLVATYMDAGGAALESREIVIKQILEPGRARRWPQIADNLVPAGATAAMLAIKGAEKAIPRR